MYLADQHQNENLSIICSKLSIYTMIILINTMKIIKIITITSNTLKHDEAVGSPQHQQSESAKV